MRSLRLRYIERISFQASEHTNFAKILESRPELKHLKPDEVVVLVSRQEDQVIFIHGFTQYHDKVDVDILTSQRHRITGKGTWNPLMLSHYAQQVGLKLVGIKKFEDYYKKLLVEKAAARKAKAKK